MYFPGVFVAKLATSIGPDLHAVSSAKSVILLLVHHQHLGQSQILVNRIPESSGKVFYCHYKPADPCHADALCASKRTSGRT